MIFWHIAYYLCWPCINLIKYSIVKINFFSPNPLRRYATVIRGMLCIATCSRLSWDVCCGVPGTFCWPCPGPGQWPARTVPGRTASPAWWSSALPPCTRPRRRRPAAAASATTTAKATRTPPTRSSTSFDGTSCVRRVTAAVTADLLRGAVTRDDRLQLRYVSILSYGPWCEYPKKQKIIH